MGINLRFDYGQTPLDENEIDGLKINSISTKRELDELEQFNIEKAITWTIGKTFIIDAILTEKFIKNLHFRMYGDVWNWAGKFRISEKNIGIPWTKISVNLQTLLDDTKFWIANKSYPDDEIVIRFKHRLVSIHCFSNGNGRHSRLLADILILALGKKQFSWNNRTLDTAKNLRSEYFSALRKADRGNIQPLIDFARN